MMLCLALCFASAQALTRGPNPRRRNACRTVAQAGEVPNIYAEDMKARDAAAGGAAPEADVAPLPEAYVAPKLSDAASEAPSSPAPSSPAAPEAEARASNLAEDAPKAEAEDAPVLEAYVAPKLSDAASEAPSSPAPSSPAAPEAEARAIDPAEDAPKAEAEDAPVLEAYVAPKLEVEDVPEAAARGADAGAERDAEASDPASESSSDAPEAVDPEADASAPANLSGAVLEDFSDRATRNLQVDKLRASLGISQQRRSQVEGVVADEVFALAEQLDRELLAEAARQKSATELTAQLEAAAAAKRNNCAVEELLLVQLQEVAQRTAEAGVRKSLETAIAVKAKLIAIELILIDDIVDCVDQVTAEKLEIALRVTAMEATKASLPPLDDGAALRAYSWGQVSQLQDDLKAGAVAIALTDAKVAALRQRINDASDQRDDALEATPTPRAEPGVPLKELTDDDLRDALFESLQETADALGGLGRAAASAFGVFIESDAKKEAGKLLADAVEAAANARGAVQRTESNATESAQRGNATESVDATDAAPAVAPSAAASNAAAALAAAAAKAAAAAAAAAAGLTAASADADVGDALNVCASSLGATITASSVVVLRAARRAIAEVQGDK